MLKLNRDKIAAFYQDTEKPHRIEWGILIIISVILFSSYLYWDIIITTRHGINVWDSLFNGRLFNYYFDNVSPQISRFPTWKAIYPFSVYLVFAIWDFPLWIMEHVFHKDPFLSTTALMYAKCILIPFLLGSAYMVYKICRELSISAGNSKWCVFFFLSSNLVFFPLVVTGQYDIFTVFFMLIGIYYYIKNDDLKFVSFFAVSISLKLFPLFVFIPLLLLRQKKISKILLMGFMSMSIYLVSSLFFSIPKDSSDVMYRMIGYLFSHTLPLTYKDVPIFVVVTVCLWIYCYIKNPENDEAPGRTAIYISFLAIAAIFVCCYTHLYWIILLSPFICILCFTNKKYFKSGFLIELMSSAAVIFGLHMGIGYMGMINNAFLPQIFGSIPSDKFDINFGMYIKELLNNDVIFDAISPSCTAAFVAGIIAFAIINFRSEPQTTEEPKINKGIIWFRLAINAFICVLPVVCYFIEK